MKVIIDSALALLAVDLGFIVVSGGVSVLGPVEVSGAASRWLLALALLVLHSVLARKPERMRFYAYTGLLLLLLPLLHFRGYRLRGDGLWYYAYAHSLAFDGDIDLTNQYERLGIAHHRGSQAVGDTGLARYTFPAGAPLVWVPIVRMGSAGAWVRNRYGIETSYDGFSEPYFHAVALGNLLIGWLGLLVLDRFLRRWFAPWTALVATLGTGLGSFLLWYLVYQPIYTHALTFLLVCLILDRWAAGPERFRDYAVLGLLVGVAASVRWQSGIFALLPAWSLGKESLRGRWRFVAQSAACFGGPFLIGILPQLLTWKIIFDRFYFGVPLGPDYMRWSDPFLTEVLFSSRHGLFSWSPLLLFAVAGLAGFLWRRPRVGLPLLGLLMLLTYVNSAVADWWGGGAFGARRFDSALPILALGLANALAWLTELVRRRPAVATSFVLASLVLANVLLMEQVRKGRIPVDDTISWETAAGGVLEDVFDAVGYPFSFPANWIFALRYDRPKTQYDLLVGKYLFHRMNNLGGVIDIGADDPPFIGNGWTGVHDWEDRTRTVRSAVGPRAGIFIPTDRPEPLRIFIECASPSGAEPRKIDVWLNGTRIGVFLPTAIMRSHTVEAVHGWQRINLIELAPSDPSPTEPYLVVDRLRFERLGR